MKVFIKEKIINHIKCHKIDDIVNVVDDDDNYIT